MIGLKRKCGQLEERNERLEKIVKYFIKEVNNLKERNSILKIDYNISRSENEIVRDKNMRLRREKQEVIAENKKLESENQNRFNVAFLFGILTFIELGVIISILAG